MWQLWLTYGQEKLLSAWASLWRCPGNGWHKSWPFTPGSRKLFEHGRVTFYAPEKPFQVMWAFHPANTCLEAVSSTISTKRIVNSMLVPGGQNRVKGKTKVSLSISLPLSHTQREENKQINKQKQTRKLWRQKDWRCQRNYWTNKQKAVKHPARVLLRGHGNNSKRK